MCRREGSVDCCDCSRGEGQGLSRLQCKLGIERLQRGAWNGGTTGKVILREGRERPISAKGKVAGKGVDLRMFWAGCGIT